MWGGWRAGCARRVWGLARAGCARVAVGRGTRESGRGGGGGWLSELKKPTRTDHRARAQGERSTRRDRDQCERWGARRARGRPADPRGCVRAVTGHRCQWHMRQDSDSARRSATMPLLASAAPSRPAGVLATTNGFLSMQICRPACRRRCRRVPPPKPRAAAARAVQPANTQQCGPRCGPPRPVGADGTKHETNGAAAAPPNPGGAHCG